MLQTLSSPFKWFFKLEAASGLVLLISAIVALIISNSSLSITYSETLDKYLFLGINNFGIKLTLLHWINDALMAVFFFFVTLEIKREFLQGELSNIKQAILPIIGAVGGMLVPALIYFYINFGDIEKLNGWAIPTATDIAFSLAVLSVLGNRVPVGLKIFLLSLAIIDDLGAVMVIAIYYTNEISYTYLLYGFLSYLLLIILNLLNVRIVSIYMFIGIFLWYFILHSGIHTTIAGVILASAIPFSIKNSTHSPLRYLEKKLHTFSGFIILPIFAFFNADIDLNTISFSSLTNSIPLGIMLGLLIGKPIGITLLTYISIKLKACELPNNVDILDVLGVSFLCGIGFTMSLFINTLAFAPTNELINIGQEFSKSGIFFGSILSGIIGYGLLKIKLKYKNE